MSEGFVLEIRRGQGEPRFLRLPRGTPLQPTSVGARGDFRVDADGVIDVHAFVYFDGETLFVQSADAAQPVRVNGRPAAADWTRVDTPATLAFGDARVVFCPASQASTVSAPTASRPAAGARPRRADMEDMPTLADVAPPGDYDDIEEVITERAAAPREDDSTHSIPLPSRVAADTRDEPPPFNEDNETTRALPLPAVVMPVMRPEPPVIVAPPPPTTSPPITAVGGPIAAPPQGAPKVDKVSPLDEVKKQWKEATLPKKAIVVLLPLAFVMVIFGLDDNAAAPTKKRARPEASASSTASSAKTASTKEQTNQEPEEEPAPKPTNAAPTTPVATGKSPPPATSSKTSDTTKTAERAAVDAVAAGSLLPAAEMYEALAKQHPENPAYREAARILRSKAKK